MQAKRCPYCSHLMGNGLGVNPLCYIAWAIWSHREIEIRERGEPLPASEETLFCTQRETSFRRIVGVGGFKYGWSGANWNTFEPAEIIEI